MSRKKLPDLLQGHFTWLKQRLKKTYRNNIEKLKQDDEWYKNVIEDSESNFNFLYFHNAFIPGDLKAMYEYIKPTNEQLQLVQEKYGVCEVFFVVLEYLLIPLYDRAYKKAIKELEINY